MSSERFIRWQSNAIAQLSFAINLFLGLATAALGFSVTLLIDEKFILQGKSKCFFAGAMVCQLFAMFFGIAAVITRTWDFRYTAQIARKVEKGREAKVVGDLRRSAACFGKWTWRLFKAQIASFVLGVIGLIISVVTAYSHKLL